ncbi:unnamed protein product [Sphenostylis stenocarpa]|uniref:Uncharacterized protein n=1 Tax=Sphenostylis stenocarpa TaxID=92480 RepID=A0AA86VM55_9FABA|nr:unnamed protein product [Sphenostylis stenocarpa]
MGSLMAGWHSPTLDPESATNERNRSLTKEQIDAYWSTKEETESEHLKSISKLSETIQTRKLEDSENSRRSTTVTLNRIEESLDKDFVKKNCWWTKSSWAFLNEPPVMEASSKNYASQFHVANLRSTKARKSATMGSLMAGWDSPTLDPQSATIERNRSLTNDEINAYWRAKKETELEHLRAISKLSDTVKAHTFKDAENSHKSLTDIKVSLGMNVDKKSLEQLMNKNCWWTKSNWAFLNEPPVIEASSNNYVSQFHVANLGSSKFNSPNKISA